MAEKPTFCPRCRHMHVGNCEAVIPPKPALQPPRIEVAREALAKFDKNAYQREYMGTYIRA